MVKSSRADVQLRAQSALSSSPIYVLRELSVQRSGDVLTICGRVDSFYHKQLAQEVVRAVVGQQQVVNSIDVE